MGSLPTSTDYQEAVQFPETAFKDPELRTGSPRTNALGLPQPISGAFAVVFPIECTTETWAVKCFLHDHSSQKKRYSTLKRHLSKSDLPYFVDFEFQQEGILVGGDWYPILKMQWADGMPLNRFVQENLDDAASLKLLHTAWVKMVAALQEASIAHGDLQHGNVLVDQSGGDLSLRLVDYDTMYVPRLRENSSPEVGHRNYQHPDRSNEDVGLYIDRFPALVISTAIQGCYHQPELWEKYDSGENMLFRREDFYEPESSRLLGDLAEIEEMEEWAERIKACCYLEPESLPPLDDLEQGKKLNMPDTRRRRQESGRQRALFEQWAPHATIAILLASALLVQGGYWPGAIGLLVSGMVLMLWGGYVHYLRLQPVRRAKHLGEEKRYHEQVIETLARDREALEEEKQHIRHTIDERKQERLEEVQDKALYDRLKHHFIHEARQVEGISHKVIVRLKASDVRTAYEASPERLRSITQMRGETKARVGMWRSALVSTYEDEIPDELSASEERRISRYIQHRTEDLDASISRIDEKIRQHRQAIDQIESRKESLPAIPVSRYVRYLIRREELPAS